MLPYKDFTLKARADDLGVFEKILMASGGKFIGTDFQKDTYFKTGRGKLKLRQGNLENLITHYERVEEHGVERTIVYRYDPDPTIEEIQNLVYCHEELGVIEKERKIYYIGHVKIHLDTLPDKRMFVE
ncbi:MAG TPA: CYTH domain-containing protein, partial [Cyclobacteriaceae bacterium]|nr:CYTH domain-containing protein [Cyclobacteriaceae bacterium]